jgi:hypothetical protein
MVLCIMEGVEAYRWDNISQGHLEITLRCFRAVKFERFRQMRCVGCLTFEWWWCWPGGACFTINDKFNGANRTLLKKKGVFNNIAHM